MGQLRTMVVSLPRPLALLLVPLMLLVLKVLKLPH
jgi:hypothetical protein